MGYAAYLRNLLRPLGVYDLRSSSFSGGEIEALGSAMDELAEYARQKQQESILLTAKQQGLELVGELFAFPVTAANQAERRKALAAFLAVNGDGFTPETLAWCLAACGTECAIRETDEPFVVEVRFPARAGVPENFEQKKKIIESILPCHLQVKYVFQWALWESVSHLTWDGARGMTFTELATP